MQGRQGVSLPASPSSGRRRLPRSAAMRSPRAPSFQTIPALCGSYLIEATGLDQAVEIGKTSATLTNPRLVARLPGLEFSQRAALATCRATERCLLDVPGKPGATYRPLLVGVAGGDDIDFRGAVAYWPLTIVPSTSRPKRSPRLN